jgi:predicted nucleic acid-binding protein
MKETVYIDSTIPSYYHDTRESIATFSEITRRWWSEMSGYYKVFISDAVVQELRRGDYPNKGKIMRFASDLVLLPISADIEQIVECYIANYVMPESSIGDATHLAYSSFYGIDYLRTWNCNHLANANKRKHIRVVNGRLGLRTPEIITPLELFEEEDER